MNYILSVFSDLEDPSYIGNNFHGNEKTLWQYKACLLRQMAGKENEEID